MLFLAEILLKFAKIKGKKVNNLVEKTYKDLPYTSRAFKASSPMRLAAIGTLLGLESKDISKARVLEIGCSFGGNILYFALNFPASQIVGIDISPEQIEGAQNLAKTLGANNAHFICADICELAKDEIALNELGKFDYIIAHGVYSWVDDRAKDALFKLISSCLAPSGLAYISYNVYPGWKEREILRDLMLFSTSHLSKIDEKISRSKSVVKSFLNHGKKDILENSNSAFSKEILNHAKDICEVYDDFYLAHEHFELSNDPKYLSDFVAHARNFGLFYLIDSALSASLIAGGNDTISALNLNERIKAEQYADFLNMRAFRASILGFASTAQRCQNALLGHFDSTLLNLLYFRASFKISGDFISSPNDEITLHKNILPLAIVFNEAFPNFLSFKELCVRLGLKGDVLAANLITLITIGAIEISAFKLPCLAYEGKKTRLKTSAKKLLSYFANTQNPVISLCGAIGEMIAINTAFEARLALLFDRRDESEILADFKDILKDKNLNDEILEQYFKQISNTLSSADFFEYI